jgi:aerobic-type carbon monoxide dehydrogenase small subunit (CoxS/CutS family)
MADETTLTVNGIRKTVEVDSRKPLLWVLRDLLNLTATRYGCGIAQCGPSRSFLKETRFGHTSCCLRERRASQRVGA